MLLCSTPMVFFSTAVTRVFDTTSARNGRHAGQSLTAALKLKYNGLTGVANRNNRIFQVRNTCRIKHTRLAVYYRIMMAGMRVVEYHVYRSSTLKP
jgi:hypothetical protein